MTCIGLNKSEVLTLFIISSVLMSCSQNPGFTPISNVPILADAQSTNNQGEYDPNNVNSSTYDPYSQMNNSNFDPYNKMVGSANGQNQSNSNNESNTSASASTSNQSDNIPNVYTTISSSTQSASNNTGDTSITITRECRGWGGRNYYYGLSHAATNPQMVARIYSVTSNGNVGKVLKQITLPNELPKNFQVNFDKGLIPTGSEAGGYYQHDKIVLDFCVSTADLRLEHNAFGVQDGCINPSDGGNISNGVRDWSTLITVPNTGSSIRAIPYYFMTTYNNGNYDPAYCDSYLGSPLVLDLDNDGIKLSGQDTNQNVFDILGNGKKIKSGWVASSRDPFLALDLNHNGVIDCGHELFGSATKLSDSTTASNGFEALKVYDTNKDNQINSADPIYEFLLLWDDQNHDKISESAELNKLSDSKVKAIGLNYEEVKEADIHGNETRQRGNFLGANGISLIVDIWFAIR